MGRGYYLSRTATSVVRNTAGGLHKLNQPSGIHPGGGFVKVDPSTHDFPRLEDRLPSHYMEFHRQWKKGPSANIHEKPRKERFEKNEHGVVIPVQNVRIPVMYPDEFHMGLWGGEGIIKGLHENAPVRHQPDYKPPKEKYWWPNLHIGVVYSEVLNKHLKVTMTKRAQRLIDENFGLDFYLLKTPVNEIYSHLGLKLKREILLHLATNKERINKDIIAKYEPYEMPEEIALWHGLPWKEAVHRLFTIDRMVEESESSSALKHEYRSQLFNLLKQGYLDDVDPSVLYEDENAIQLPGAIAKTSEFLKRKGQLYFPGRKE